jgi:hypothetical protein
MTLPPLRRTPAEPGSVNRRRRSRSPVRVMADFRKPGRTPFRVVVTDLSETGCRCDTTSRINIGDKVWISIEGFAAVEAYVRWADHRGFGAEWLQPMHVSVFDHICRMHPGLRRQTVS